MKMLQTHLLQDCVNRNTTKHLLINDFKSKILCRMEQIDQVDEIFSFICIALLFFANVDDIRV